MAEISAKQVMELRAKTGAGVMDCKKALVESNGDEEKAIVYLREKGITKAEKKSSRIASEGLVAIYISDDNKVGAIVEVNSETDFVAKNEKFVKFVEDIAKQVAVNNPKDVEDLLAEKYIDDESQAVKDVLTNLIATIGENMNIRRFERVETEGFLGKYIHANGQIGVLVDMAKGSDEVAKNIAMQICAVKPEYLDRTKVPEDRVKDEMEVLKAQVINEGKPEAIAEKIVNGRIGKFYEDICLVDQVYVKDQSKKVSDYLKENDAEISNFIRFERGEGLEKKQENFAEEVAAQMAK